MTFNLHPEAVTEFNAAIDWYEARSSGLGWDFANEIRAAINRAVAMPLAWHILEAISGGHWCNAFSKAYFTYQSQINSPAIMHLRQRPGYWRNRTSTPQ
jgi:hypothetical protein